MILFDHPTLWRLFFAVVVLFIVEVAIGNRRQDSLKKMVRQGLRSQFIVSQRRSLLAMRAALLVLTAALGIAAVMGPKGNPQPLAGSAETEVLDETVGSEGEEETVLARRRAHDIIFLVDASASMEVADTRMGASRLDYAKEIVDEIVSRLQGEAVALYAFTSELTTIVPATVDYLYFRLQLRRIKINEGDAAGTDLMEALDQVTKQHGSGGREKARTLVLLTDGGDTRLEALKGEARQQEISAILSRLDASKDSALTTYCIGLGSHEGQRIPGLEFEGQPVSSSLDEALLKALAQKGKGSYSFANDKSALSIADEIIRAIESVQSQVEEELTLPSMEVDRTVAQEDAQVSYRHYFRLPLLLAICALAGELLLSMTRSRRRA